MKAQEDICNSCGHDNSAHTYWGCYHCDCDIKMHSFLNLVAEATDIRAIDMNFNLDYLGMVGKINGCTLELYSLPATRRLMMIVLKGQSVICRVYMDDTESPWFIYSWKGAVK